MCLSAVDPDLALVGRRGVVEQPDCAIKLHQGIRRPTRPKQEIAVLAMYQDLKGWEPPALSNAFRVAQRLQTFGHLTTLVQGNRKAEKDPGGQPVTVPVPGGPQPTEGLAVSIDIYCRQRTPKQPACLDQLAVVLRLHALDVQCSSLVLNLVDP